MTENAGPKPCAPNTTRLTTAKVSMKRLRTVAGVAVAIARAQDITTREALLLLAVQAQSGALPLRLFHAGSSAADVGPIEIGGDEAMFESLIKFKD